jgi:hypothetical protein
MGNDSSIEGTKMASWGQALVAHACNPSCSEGRDQEDHGSKPAQANRSQEPISKKKPSQKRAGEVVQGVGPEFKPQYCKKKKKRRWHPG